MLETCSNCDNSDVHIQKQQYLRLKECTVLNDRFLVGHLMQRNAFICFKVVMKNCSEGYTFALVALIVIVVLGNAEGALIQYNGTMKLPSIALPLDRWLPDSNLNVNGMLRSCPGVHEEVDGNGATAMIPFCYLNSAAPYKTLEDAMRMCNKHKFPALVIVTYVRPGEGWRLTDASRDAPQIPTIEIHAKAFAMANISEPVTLTFDEGNYALSFQSSGGWIFQEIVHAIATFVIFPALVYAAIAHYAKHGRITLPVVAYALSATSNIPRFFSGLDLYNSHHMWHHCIQRGVWTISLPMTISATALFILVEDQVLSKAMGYTKNKVSTWSRVRFWIFCAYVIATPLLDFILSVYTCYGGDLAGWTAFPTIGLLAIGNLFIMGYSIYMYVKLRRAIFKMADSPRRQETLARLKYTRVALGVLSLTWVVLLIFQWFVQGIKDDYVYIRVVLSSGWVGVMCALCMCYVHFFILKLPRTHFLGSRSGTTSGTTARKATSHDDAKGSSDTKKSHTSTSSTLVVSNEASSIDMETLS